MPTFSESRHPRRRVLVILVARPQLPVAVEAPAVDAAARQQGARVSVSLGEGDGSLGRRRRILLVGWLVSQLDTNNSRSTNMNIYLIRIC